MADVEYTVQINLDDLELCETPEEVGLWMVGLAISNWHQYDEDGKFVRRKRGNSYTLRDPGMNRSVTFTTREFLAKHVELIWLERIENYRTDWIEFASKRVGATADEYDANTVDAVLQNMLYGSVVYS